MFLAAPRGLHARSAATAPASLREFKERANLAGLRASLLFPTDCRLVVICDIYQDRDQLLQRFFTCLRAQRSVNLCPVALCFKSASLSLGGLARVRPRAAPPRSRPRRRRLLNVSGSKRKRVAQCGLVAIQAGCRDRVQWGPTQVLRKSQAESPA